jgi:hypothetical protein
VPSGREIQGSRPKLLHLFFRVEEHAARQNEDGHCKFIYEVYILLPDYTASHSTRQKFHINSHVNLKFSFIVGTFRYRFIHVDITIR